LNTVRRIPCFSQVFACGLVLCFGGGSGALADPPAGTDAAGSTAAAGDGELAPGNFFSSLKQAFGKDFDHEIIRGHFDVGTAPNARRYYCLVDPKKGKKEPNGVLGTPIPVANGMTGIKDSSVSLYSCSDAQKQGMLVTTGYVLSAAAAGKTTPPVEPQTKTQVQVLSPPQAPPQPQPQPLQQPQSLQAPSPSPSPSPPPAPVLAAAPTVPAGAADKVDVAGVRLGMSPDEVRAILKSKKLLDYYEATESLGHFDAAKGIMQPIADGRFVNVIATWSPAQSSSVGDPLGEEGESYEVMFTPVPGRERVMAIVHSVGYSPANAVRQTALDSGLTKKYGGFAAANDLPESPTWRFQSGGGVLVGDPCNRRGIFGGLGGLNAGNAIRQNLALKTTADEFRFQMDHCGVAIVTEDHSTANSGAPRENRLITRFTVTAYSPSIGFEGATAAAQLVRMEAMNKTSVATAKDPLSSTL
jgi:hypothetical protein